jgi:hypothetical protein
MKHDGFHGLLLRFNSVVALAENRPGRGCANDTSSSGLPPIPHANGIISPIIDVDEGSSAVPRARERCSVHAGLPWFSAPGTGAFARPLGLRASPLTGRRSQRRAGAGRGDEKTDGRSPRLSRFFRLPPWEISMQSEHIDSSRRVGGGGPSTLRERMMRGAIGILFAATMAGATAAAAQTSNPNGERSHQRAGESGAAKSGAITPKSMNDTREAHEIIGTAGGSISLSANQRRAINDYFAAKRSDVNRADRVRFTISVGAAIPRQVNFHRCPAILHAHCPHTKAINTSSSGASS